jgi:hypothetical protein
VIAQKKPPPVSKTGRRQTKITMNHYIQKTEENQVPKFTYLFTAETADGDVLLFAADKASCAKAGDYIMHDGQLFNILHSTYEDRNGEVFQLLNDLGQIREVDAIYCCRWLKEAQDV